MKTEQLKAVVCIVQHGSFSKASESLFISKQALLKQISSLEAELGFDLFARNSKGVGLTKAGQKFHEELKKQMARMDTLVENCRAIAMNDKIIRIANPSHPKLVLEKAMDAFSMKYPDVMQEIVYINAAENPIHGLLDNLYDISVLSNRPEYIRTAGIASTPVGKHPCHCLMTKSNPLSTRETISLGDIADYKIGLHKLTRKIDIIQELQRINPAIDIVESIGDEIKFIFNLCFTGGVYISKAYFVKTLSPLIAIPLAPDFPDNIGVFYRENPPEILLEFIEQVKEMYTENYPSYVG